MSELILTLDRYDVFQIIKNWINAVQTQKSHYAIQLLFLFFEFITK